MSARVQISLAIKFDKLIVEQCQEGYEQAIAQGASEEEAIESLRTKIQEKVINPFFQSEEFKSAYDSSSSSAKKSTPLKLAKMQYQETADREIKETIKGAWQMAMEMKSCRKQEAKDHKIEAKQLPSDKAGASKSSHKGLFGRKT